MQRTFSARSIIRIAATAAIVATPLLGQARPVTHGDLAGLSNNGKPFEELCSGRMVGIAVRTEVNGRHIGIFAVGDTGRHIAAIAPICESADGSRSDLVWHGGTGKDDRAELKPGEHVIAISGTFGGRNGEQLASLQLHAEFRTSDTLGQASHSNEQHIMNELFIHSTPRRMIPVGLYGRAGDAVSKIGVVYADAAPVAAVAALANDSANHAVPADVAAAIDRGVKAHGKTEDASSRTSIMSPSGFYVNIAGPLNQIANAASANAKQKHAYTADSVPSPYPGYVEVTAKPFDSGRAKVGRLSSVIFTAPPTTMNIVFTKDGQEQTVQPVYTQLAYFPTVNSDDPNGGTNDPFVGGGMTALFPASALPAGEFTVHIECPGKLNFTIKFDDKARARIK